MKLAISYNEMVKEFLGKVEGSIKIPKDVQGTELRIKRKTELFPNLTHIVDLIERLQRGYIIFLKKTYCRALSCKRKFISDYY